MEETRKYTDLLKAHTIFKEEEGRWKFYDTYMKNRDSDAWMKSSRVPLKEGLLLFGFIQSWDPNFKGELYKFIETYENIHDIIKKFERVSIVDAVIDNETKKIVMNIFDKIAVCTKKQRFEKKPRFESTDTSKILHAILPNFFVMWDRSIRKAILGEGRERGKDYAYEFLPKMKRCVEDYLNDYINNYGDSYQTASLKISKKSGGYSIAKLIDEFNFMRYTRWKSLLEIRSVP